MLAVLSASAKPCRRFWKRVAKTSSSFSKSSAVPPNLRSSSDCFANSLVSSASDFALSSRLRSSNSAAMSRRFALSALIASILMASISIIQFKNEELTRAISLVGDENFTSSLSSSVTSYKAWNAAVVAIGTAATVVVKPNNLVYPIP